MVISLSKSIATGSMNLDSTIINLRGTMRISPSSRSSSSSTEGETEADIILSRLTSDDLEIAALASYEYIQLTNPTHSDRVCHARKIAKRYLNSKNNVEKATTKLKETLEFRRKLNIMGLITAFNIRNQTSIDLYKHLSDKKFYVQGYDKKGRSTLFFIPRLVRGHDSEWTLKEAVYSIERAIACTKSKDGLINAIVDFSGFSITKHSPPLDIGKQFLTALRNHYAGQIHRIYLLDTPPSFAFFWKIFKQFIGSKTKEKIYFISGEQQHTSKLLLLEDAYSLDQVPSWMLRGGEKNRPLDLDAYLFGTPFNKAFDELI